MLGGRENSIEAQQEHYMDKSLLKGATCGFRFVSRFPYGA